IRRDKQRNTTGLPFLSDIPILGRAFSNKDTEEQNTDLVMTITPHIIRVPDINERDLMPIYVGTENNVSYQGAPRVESINDNRSPFETEQQRRRQQSQRPTPNNPRRPTAQPGGINLAPSGFSTSPFSTPKSFAIPPISSPPPSPPPPGAENNLSPGTGTDPTLTASAAGPAIDAAAAAAQPETLASGAGPAAAADPSTSAADPSAAVPTATIVSGTQFAFDPPVAALPAGQEQTVVIEASGTEGIAPSKIGIDFDPAVVQVSKVEPLNGGSVEPVSDSRVALSLPGGGSPLTGPHPIARLTLRGVAAGNGSITLDATALTLADGGPAIVSSSPMQDQVK
ncbi:MAG TPA: hypothetical protein VG777_02685, partial [Thermoanaerobaculia bacterium]|nr:hypothetical protein [Thermoanaerobaculia bacterium]